MPFQALNLTSVAKPTPSFQPLGASTDAPPAVAGPQPSFLQNLVGGAKTFGSDIYKSFTAPVAAVTNTGSIGGDIAQTSIDSYVNSLKDAGSRLQNLQNVTTDPNTTTLQRGTALGEAALGGLNAFFAPLTAAGAGAAHIPVLGPVAQGINNLFSAIGKGGSDIGEGALQAIPGLSQQTKDQLSPLVQEVFALGAQVAAGGGKEAYDALKGKATELTHTIADKVSEEIPKNPTLVDKPTPSFEPLKTATTPDTTGNSVAEVVRPPVEVAKPTSEVANTIAPESAVPTETATPEPNKTSGVAERISTASVESGLTKSGYNDLASYEGTTKEAQATAIKNVYDQGLDHVTSILRGSTELPAELRPGALVRYTEQFIKDNPKDPQIADLSHALANSKHTGAFSQAGSDLSASVGFADSPTGKLDAARAARAARAGATKQTASRAVPARAREAMNKMNLSGEDLGKLESFIDKITC